MTFFDGIKKSNIIEQAREINALLQPGKLPEPLMGFFSEASRLLTRLIADLHQDQTEEEVLITILAIQGLICQIQLYNSELLHEHINKFKKPWWKLW